MNAIIRKSPLHQSEIERQDAARAAKTNQPEPPEFPDGEFPNYKDSVLQQSEQGYPWTQADRDDGPDPADAGEPITYRVKEDVYVEGAEPLLKLKAGETITLLSHDGRGALVEWTNGEDGFTTWTTMENLEPINDAQLDLEADPIMAITDEQAEYLAAKEALDGEESYHRTTYRGWVMAQLYGEYWAVDGEGTYLRSTTADGLMQTAHELGTEHPTPMLDKSKAHDDLYKFASVAWYQGLLEHQREQIKWHKNGIEQTVKFTREIHEWWNAMDPTHQIPQALTFNPATDTPIEAEPEQPEFKVYDLDLTEEGRAYLDAIVELQRKGWVVFKGWYVNGHSAAFWASNEAGWLVRCPTAKEAITAVWNLTNTDED